MVKSKHNRNKTVIILAVFVLALCVICTAISGCGSKKKSGHRRIRDAQEVPVAAQNEPLRSEPTQPAQPMTIQANPDLNDLRITSSTVLAAPSDAQAEADVAVADVLPETMPARPLDTMPEVIETPEAEFEIPVLSTPGMADELISVNFDQADIRTVLKAIGDITGINFVVDESVRGTVTVMSPTKIRLGEVYDVLESILEVHGFAAVPAGSLVKIVPKAKAATKNGLVRFGSDPARIPQGDSIITQIMPLQYADAAEVSSIISPLVAPDSELGIYPRTNAIIITDTAASIRHIAQVIQRLDVAGSQEQVSVIPLQYASAQVLAEQISRIMQKENGAVSQAVRARAVSGGGSDGRILADARTNSLIVVADPQDTQAIRSLAQQLDVQRPVGANNVHVTYLQNAKAKEVADSLTAALTNLKISGALEGTQPVQVTADEGTNSVIIAASPQDYELIQGIIEKLDIVREQVLVEMLIMEVSEDGLKEIGVDWASLDQSVDGSVRGFAATSFGPRVDFASGNLEGLAVGLWKGTGSNLRIGTMLHALDKQTGVNILSTPHILTLNHNTAKIIVGDNRPFVTESRITETTDFITPTVIKTFEYKDVGITLEITPHISQGGLIRLEVSSEFTKLIESSSSASTDTPTTAKRQAETTVSMQTGSTVVIGGLIRDDKVTIKKKVPLLGDMPGLGGLFRFKRDQLEKTNLMIFITPHIIRNQEELERATERKKKEILPAWENRDKKDAAQ